MSSRPTTATNAVTSPPRRPAQSSARQPLPDTIPSQYIVAFQHHMRRANKAGPTRMQGVTKPDLHMDWGANPMDDWEPPSPRSNNMAEPLPPARNIVCGGVAHRKCEGDGDQTWMTSNSLPMPKRVLAMQHTRPTELSPQKKRLWIDNALEKEMKKSLLFIAPRPNHATTTPKLPQRPATCKTVPSSNRLLVSHKQQRGISALKGSRLGISTDQQRDAKKKSQWTTLVSGRQSAGAVDQRRPLTADEIAVRNMSKAIQTGRRNINLPPSISATLVDKARRQSTHQGGGAPMNGCDADNISTLTDVDILGAVSDPVLRNDLKQKKRLWKELYSITKSALTDTQRDRKATERQIQTEIDKMATMYSSATINHVDV